MIPRIFITAVLATALSACGGSSGGSSNNGSGSNNGGGNNNNGGGGSGLTGEAGDFGDTADQSNSVAGSFTLCPAGTLSFSIFAQVNGNWCVPGCPDSFENDDGDEYGSFTLPEDPNLRYACLITTAQPGSQVAITNFSAPINGCDAASGGCPAGSFPQVYFTATAGDELAGDYRCADWEFDVDAQDWNELTSPAPFSLTLNVDRTATISGATTTWSFSSGSLNLEGNRVFNNVAVGTGSFTEYKSNIAVTRCKV